MESLIDVNSPCHPNTDGKAVTWSDYYGDKDSNKIYRIYYRENEDTIEHTIIYKSYLTRSPYFSDLHPQVCGENIYFQRVLLCNIYRLII